VPDFPAPGDDMFELYDADVPRVDLVGLAANGVPGFLLMKQAADARGLLDAEFVRDLVAKSAPAPEPVDQVTMSGSPAAIAALIHGAPVRKAAPEDTDAPVEKAEVGTADQNDLPDSDFAYVESGGTKDDEGKTVPRSLRHFPIQDEAHVRNALSRAPQSPFGDKAMPKIRAAAKKFGIDVAKAAGMAMDDGIDGMDPTVVMAEPDMDDAPGDPADPGSPAWEAVDAATARKWTSILARARTALGVMADREALEAATGDDSDMDNALDLDDAACAIDYAISVLAPFAVDEQAEADCGTDMEMLGKALAGFDPAALETVEALAPLAKAGRALSAANETAIRAALTSLQNILASLPKAPDAPEADTAVMSKETAVQQPQDVAKDMTEDALTGRPPLGTPKDPAEAETPAAVPGPGAVAKAQQDPVVPMFDADGNLTGFVMPTNVIPIAKPPAPPAPAATDDDSSTADATAAAPDAPDAPPADMTPAPAATVGTPADATTADDDANVAKAATNDDTTETVLKSIAENMFKAAFDDYSAKQESAAAAARAEQAEIVKSLEERNQALEDRLERVENAPAVMAIASNGAIPPQHLMRGQDRGGSVDVTKGEQLRTAFKASDDARQQKVLAEDLNMMAIEKLHEIHAAGAR
jgi:hypothetical protein